MAKNKTLDAMRRSLKMMPPLSSLITASPVVEEYAAILQLLHKYCHVVDRGTLDQIVALFHQDAVLLPRYKSMERYEGREAIRSWYERWIAHFRAPARHLRHTLTSPVIEITGNEATAVCYVDVEAFPNARKKPWVVRGRYDDKLIKDSGHWWFGERAVMLYDASSLAAYRKGRKGKSFKFQAQNSQSKISPKSKVQSPKSKVQSPKSKVQSRNKGKTA